MSHKIDLPFSERMRRAVLNGRKCCTTRRTRKGDPGDWFALDGETFRILDICPLPLWRIRDLYFLLEGCTSKEHFECLWRYLHGGAFEEHAICWVHFFVRFPIPDEILEEDREGAPYGL